MRILLLSTWYPVPSDNGSKLRVAALLQALTEAHAVTLVSFAFGSARPDAENELMERCTAVHTLNINPFEENATGSLRRFASASPVFARPIPAMQQLTRQMFAENEFDGVIASTEMMAPYALQLSAPIARVLEEHNSLTRWMRGRVDEQTGLLGRVRCRVSAFKAARFEANLFKQFDLVTMVSDEDRAVSEQVAPDARVVTVPNGVDTTLYRMDEDGSRPRSPHALIYNGALTYAANYDAMRTFLAEIYPRIQAALPDVTLTITGSTAGVDLAGLAMDDSVRLTGFLDDIRVPVAEASVCVVPLRQGGGTRLKILEAMALGTPVVSTSKGAEGLAAVSGRDLLIADTPESFATEVIRVLRTAELADSLAAHARQLVVSHYDWQPIGQQFTQLIEQISAETHPDSRSRPTKSQR